MKKSILTTIALLFAFIISFAQAEEETTFGVRGNCGMCKHTIENAVNSIDGVASSEWDQENKKIKVSFDTSKTTLESIHNAIAASGYDTENTKAADKVYNELPGCCQYDRAMDITTQAAPKKE